MLVLILAAAHAASLDNLEVGGVWGSPTAANPTAAWWNPASLATIGQHQILAEGAPTFATVTNDRADPNGGVDTLGTQAVVPFFGASSHLGVDGLGVGASLSIPMARGSASELEAGSSQYHLQSGDIIAAYATLAASYEVMDKVAVGFSAHRVLSTWSATIQNDIMPDLYDELVRQDLEPDPDIYNDGNLENPDYAAGLDLGPLTDSTWTWSAGLLLRPSDAVSIGLSYTAGYDLDHTGDAQITMGCPPQDDTFGRFGAESRGLCDTTLSADASIGYRIPQRIHAGVSFEPSRGLRIEAFGGFVGWSSFEDFEVVVSGVADQNPDLNPDAAGLVEQERRWARANEDSFFLGVDAKRQLGDRWLAGGRLTFDKAAVPDVAAGPNNYDADALIAAGVVGFRPTPAVTIGLSYGHHFVAERTITDSGFSMAIDPAQRPEDRWNYPHSNGTYNVSIDRLGLSAAVGF